MRPVPGHGDRRHSSLAARGTSGVPRPTDEDIDALFDLARTNGIMPIVRRTARFNEHRELILALFKHAPARRLLFKQLVGRTAASRGAAFSLQ